jgi:hypothetical protein
VAAGIAGGKYLRSALVHEQTGGCRNRHDLSSTATVGLLGEQLEIVERLIGWIVGYENKGVGAAAGRVGSQSDGRPARKSCGLVPLLVAYSSGSVVNSKG